jgi:hypothetical protein
MATRRKKPFVLLPGFAGAISAFLMAWMNSGAWFLGISGLISIFDFAMRPAVPSIIRIVYPEHCRAHVAGTMRQYASIVLLCSTLLSASLLAASGNQVRHMSQMQLVLAGFAGMAAFACFRQLPDHGDGSAEEAIPSRDEGYGWVTFSPLRDRMFRRYLAIFFVFGSANLFHSGIVPAFFARDMGLGYTQATLLIHVIPNVCAFLSGAV